MSRNSVSITSFEGARTRWLLLEWKKWTSVYELTTVRSQRERTEKWNFWTEMKEGRKLKEEKGVERQFLFSFSCSLPPLFFPEPLTQFKAKSTRPTKREQNTLSLSACPLKKITLCTSKTAAASCFSSSLVAGFQIDEILLSVAAGFGRTTEDCGQNWQWVHTALASRPDFFCMIQSYWSRSVIVREQTDWQTRAIWLDGWNFFGRALLPCLPVWKYFARMNVVLAE